MLYCTTHTLLPTGSSQPAKGSLTLVHTVSLCFLRHTQTSPPLPRKSEDSRLISFIFPQSPEPFPYLDPVQGTTSAWISAVNWKPGENCKHAHVLITDRLRPGIAPPPNSEEPSTRPSSALHHTPGPTTPDTQAWVQETPAVHVPLRAGWFLLRPLLALP